MSLNLLKTVRAKSAAVCMTITAALVAPPQPQRQPGNRPVRSTS